MGQTNLKSIFSLFQHSGGWAYHKKYLRYGRAWAEFRSPLNLWLDTQLKSDLSLLLIGPSAGYNLDDSLLKRFPEISALDVDRWAKWFWSFQHSAKVRNWSHHNYFLKDADLDPEVFQNLEADFPNHQILFCNLLGQLGFLFPMTEQRAETLKQGLTELERPWCSFHDLYSLHGPRKKLLEFQSRLPSEIHRSQIDEILGSAPPSLQISDHWTRLMIPEQKNSRLFPWFLTKNSLHIVEAAGNT